MSYDEKILLHDLTRIFRYSGYFFPESYMNISPSSAVTKAAWEMIPDSAYSGLVREGTWMENWRSGKGEGIPGEERSGLGINGNPLPTATGSKSEGYKAES